MTGKREGVIQRRTLCPPDVILKYLHENPMGKK